MDKGFPLGRANNVSSDSNPPSVLLCGYYGEGNLGDELTLSILLKIIDKSFSILISTNKPVTDNCTGRQVKNINRKDLLSILKSVNRVDNLVLGGGSLLQDQTSIRSLIYYLLIIVFAHIKNINIILWAQGIGPLNSRLSIFLVKRVLGLVSYISVRDLDSYMRIQSMKIRIPVVFAPDPVFQFPQKQWIGGGPIVLSWCKTKFLNMKKWKELFNALDEFLNEQGKQAIWLSFDKSKDPFLLNELNKKNIISDSLKSKIVKIEAMTFEHATDLFQKACLAIPMRLHALILAQLAGCPTCALGYDPKVKSASEMLKTTCFNLSQDINSQYLKRVWNVCLNSNVDTKNVRNLGRLSLAHASLLHKNLVK